MSKGTKQIRYGRVEKLIENVDLWIKVKKDWLKYLEREGKQDSFEYGETFGGLMVLETMRKSLVELGE